MLFDQWSLGRLSVGGGGAKSLGSFVGVFGVFAKHPEPLSGASRVMDPCPSASLLKYGRRRKFMFMVDTSVANDQKLFKNDCEYQ